MYAIIERSTQQGDEERPSTNKRFEKSSLPLCRRRDSNAGDSHRGQRKNGYLILACSALNLHLMVEIRMDRVVISSFCGNQKSFLAKKHLTNKEVDISEL